MRAWGSSSSSSRRNFVCDSFWRGVNPSSVRPKHRARWKKRAPLQRLVPWSHRIVFWIRTSRCSLPGLGKFDFNVSCWHTFLQLGWQSAGSFFSRSLSCKLASITIFIYLLSVESCLISVLDDISLKVVDIFAPVVGEDGCCLQGCSSNLCNRF